jgi:Domain of unknown function (DUF4380)
MHQVLWVAATLVLTLFVAARANCLANANSPARCQVQAVTFEGWKAEELSNEWVRVTLVPQLGGRVMQVQFGGHDYLFVNPRYKGKYIPPTEAGKRWINYGGDKLWPMPEGHEDADHWPGPVSDVLDDGEYSLRTISEESKCTVRLEGTADSATGLQFSREITVEGSSPKISFHAEVKNASNHAIRWSVQSVTQYNTADAEDGTRYNHDFWAFSPINPHSAFIDGFHVRNGLADDPSFAVTDGLFTLHWLYLENEVWLDSNAGWIAIVDGTSQFGIVEKYKYAETAKYPGRASVIFYKNGAALALDSDGMPRLRDSEPQHAPYYMEAELNSPMVHLESGSSFAFDTQWYPVRADKGIKSVSELGVVEAPLVAVLKSDGLHLSGKFGIFFPGELIAQIFDKRGGKQEKSLGKVDPLHAVLLDQTIAITPNAARVSLHLIGERGTDLGVIGEAAVGRPGKDS